MYAKMIRVPSFLSAALLLVFGLGRAGSADVFLRGDANADGTVSMSDGLMIRRWIFIDGLKPPCVDAADTDDNGFITFTDHIRILNQLFPNNPAEGWPNVIPEPYPEMGVDETDRDDLDCESYVIEPPLQTDDIIRLGSFPVAAGQEVEVPIFMTNSVEVDAIQIAITYDPQLFTPGRRLNFEGSVYEPFRNDRGPVPSNGFAALQSWPDLGLITVGIVGNIVWTGQEILPGTNQLVAVIPGVVSADAEPGAIIVLEPLSEPSGPHGMRTELTHRGEARYVATVPTSIPGRMQVVPDIAIFIRGDTNNDGTVDISDPQATLGYLFLGDRDLGCLDAADANDDGVVNIADPVATLNRLFLGGPPLPRPTAALPATDWTADELHCLVGLSR